MKTLTYALSAFTFFTFSSSFAQVSAQGVSGTGVLSFYKSNSNKKSTIIGSQYIDEAFSAAKVNGGTQPFQIRFNAFTNVMEYKKDNDELVLIKKDNKLVEFTNGKIYELNSFTDKRGNNEQSYFAIIKKEAKVSILKLEKVTLSEARSASNTYDTGSPAEYKRSSDAYYLKLGDKVSELPTKSKDFVKLIPNKETEIKDFFKNNKISFKDDADLIKLTTFLNSIL